MNYGDFTHYRAARTKRKLPMNVRGWFVKANISRHHPDYGMTVAEHESAKAQREYEGRHHVGL